MIAFLLLCCAVFGSTCGQVALQICSDNYKGLFGVSVTCPNYCCGTTSYQYCCTNCSASLNSVTCNSTQSFTNSVETPLLYGVPQSLSSITASALVACGSIFMIMGAIMTGAACSVIPKDKLDRDATWVVGAIIVIIGCAAIIAGIVMLSVITNNNTSATSA